MALVKFATQSFSCNQNESLLDCLLRHGQRIPHSCKAGMCQACLVKTVHAAAPATAQTGIKDVLRDQGYALACQWMPVEDAEISLPAADAFSVALSIRSLTPLNARTLQVHLVEPHTGEMFHYLPGQYLTFTGPDYITRAYSTASHLERDGYIELHVGNTRYGKFTHWLFNEAKPGQLLQVRGPAGDCFYSSADDDEQTLILAATGTGLAPLYGIFRDALSQGHQPPIHLFHGGETFDHLYLQDTLSALASQYPQFHYHPCIMDKNPHTNAFTGTLEEGMNAILTDSLKAARVFLSGAPETVENLRRYFFLRGVRPGQISYDAFLEKPVEGN